MPISFPPYYFRFSFFLYLSTSILFDLNASTWSHQHHWWWTVSSLQIMARVFTPRVLVQTDSTNCKITNQLKAQSYHGYRTYHGYHGYTPYTSVSWREQLKVHYQRDVMKGQLIAGIRKGNLKVRSLNLKGLYLNDRWEVRDIIGFAPSRLLSDSKP